MCSIVCIPLQSELSNHHHIMSRIAYSFHQPSPETNSWFSEYKCDKVFFESKENIHTRPKLLEAIRSLSPGDEFVIGKFSHVVRGSFGFMNLIEICRELDIRIISVEDRIDTKDILFDSPSSQSLFRIMGQLPMEVLELRQSIEAPKPYATSVPQTKVRETKRHRNIVAINMYLAGQEMKAIYHHTGISSTTLYRLLQTNGITKRRRQR